MKKHELRSCGSCGQLVSVPVRRPNHILHAIMTVLTMGLWLIIWFGAMLEASVARPGKCPVCKGKV